MKIYSIEIASILWIQILCNTEVAWFSTAHHSLKIHLLYKMLKNVVTPFNALLFTPLKLKLVYYFLQRFSFLKNCDFSQSTYFCSKCVIIRVICTLISDTRNLWPLCLHVYCLRLPVFPLMVEWLRFHLLHISHQKIWKHKL